MLKNTVRELLVGSHDIELDGQSQSDMEHILKAFNKNASTAEKMRAHDSTDTLKLFWDEQVCVLCMNLLGYGH